MRATSKTASPAAGGGDTCPCCWKAALGKPRTDTAVVVQSQIQRLFQPQPAGIKPPQVPLPIWRVIRTKNPCRRSKHSLKLLSGDRAATPRRTAPLTPRCGKSQFAKEVGNETGRLTLVLDVGALLGSLVGQSESNVRAALKLADAMAPCVLFCDEIEKALAGATSSGQTDSGGTARVFCSLLTWLNDHESDVFFVGTCNDASKLPPEFARAEGFDGVFFVDLPGRDQKDAIWGICTNFCGLKANQARLDDTNWTGAEIKSCCRRQDRGSPPVGFRPVPVSSSGGRVFAVGKRRCQSGAECGAGGMTLA